MYTKFISVSLHMSLITQHGNSVLMLAALEGRTEVVSLLLEARANTDLQTKVKCRCDLGILCTQSLSVYHCMFFITQDGDFALIMAVTMKGSTEVSLLLEAGANTDLQDKVKWRCDLGILCTQSLSAYHCTCLSSHSMETLY